MSQAKLSKVNNQQPQRALWNGEHRLFFPWHAGVVRDLRSEGLESCIRPNFVVPVVPHAALEAVANGRANAVQNTVVYQYQSKLESNDIKCQKALGMLTSTLGEDMEQRFDYIISAFDLSARDKVFNLYESIVHAYSRDTVHLVTVVENEMQSLPPVTSYEGAIVLLYEINKRNNELNCMPKAPHPGALPDAPIVTNRMSDEALKKLLVRKMGAAPVFSGLMDNFANHPEWSWSKVQEIIRDTHMRISSSDVSSSVKAAERDFQSFNDSSTAVMNVQSINPNPKYVARKGNRACWNCKCEGHTTSDCPALFCRNCGMFWTNSSDKTFHFPAVCVKRPGINNKRKAEQEVGEKKKKVNSVKFDSNVKCSDSIWDQMCRDEAVTVVNDEEDDVEAILNSVHDVYLSSSSSEYLIFGIATKESVLSSQDSTMLMLDSGAAISVTHPEVAKLFNVPIIKLSQPTILHFANNTSAEACYMLTSVQYWVKFCYVQRFLLLLLV